MDMEEAIKWLEVGVAKNEISSVTKLAEIYAEGIGIEKSLEKSLRLNELAEEIEESETVRFQFD